VTDLIGHRLRGIGIDDENAHQAVGLLDFERSNGWVCGVGRRLGSGAGRPCSMLTLNPIKVVRP
jgi:hypothetical protein